MKKSETDHNPIDSTAVTGMTISRSRIAALAAILISASSSGTLRAGTLQFGVVGSPIDLSANVSEAILPGGTIFHDSDPLFGTEPDPKQSAERLYTSPVGVNPSAHSKLSGAFASSLAESALPVVQSPSDPASAQ